MQIDVAELEALASSFAPSQMIIWTGAGISLDSPTRLPLGYTLTEFAIGATCGAEVSARLFALWERANTVCAEPERREPFGWRPRLESVLGGLGELERGAADPSLAFLPGFTSFAAAPPNAVHFAVAAMVLRGAAAFTANFDLCLQQAVCRLTGQADPFEVEIAGSLRRYRLKGAPHGGEIVHFHGVADDPEYLGATLSRIKQGLPEPFPVLESRLRAGALLLMIGYSASDSFDVNPYFARQAPGTWPRSALVYVRHEGRPAPPQLSGLAPGFGRWGEVSAHTGLLMAALAGAIHPVSAEPAFDWKAPFTARLAASAGATRALRTCAIATALGINVDLLDPRAYESAESQNPGFDSERYHHLLAVAGRERGRPDKEREHHLHAGRSEDDLLGYDYARGDLRSARERAMPAGAILHMARAGDAELSWAPYTSLSAHARPLVSRYALRPWTCPRGDDLDEVARLAEAAAALGGQPTRGVQFIRQIATAWRFRLLLAVLAGDSPPRLEAPILDLYAELADLAGFVSSYRDFAFARLLRMRYAPRKLRPVLVREAGGFALRSYRLARIIGDRSGMRRAEKLGLLVSGYAVLWPFVPRLSVSSPYAAAA